MIKAVIFDCFGVLTTDRWKEFCATLPLGPVLEAARQFNHAYDRAELTEQQFIQKIQELTGRKPEQVEATLDNETNKNTELLGYIAKLKPRYKIGLLSNIASNWIRDSFLTPEELKLFDDVVLSFEVKMTKPDPRIFKLAVQRLGIQPAEAVMVDDIDPYCEAAREVGLQAIVYQDFHQLLAQLDSLLARG